MISSDSGSAATTISTCGRKPKPIEKLRYLHRNPVTRGLVSRPEDWEWSSFRHWATGVEGVVEIESQWTARKRERLGTPLTVKFDASLRRTLP
jgi:hypothetical protein